VALNDTRFADSLTSVLTSGRKKNFLWRTFTSPCFECDACFRRQKQVEMFCLVYDTGL